jgi:predicted Zn-dependent protease with MMP-like domain
MTRKRFRSLVKESLDTLPARFRALIENVAVVLEDFPAGQQDPELLLKSNRNAHLLLGQFVGIPRTQKSVWDTAGPDRIVLYQKNIEAVCDNEDEIREQVRLTVLHEFGHYFGMDEQQLKDV